MMIIINSYFEDELYEEEIILIYNFTRIKNAL